MLSARNVIDAWPLAVKNVGPLWFTSVMGTGILGVCLAGAPLQAPVLAVFGRAFFTLAAALFATCVLLWATQIAGDRKALAATLLDPVKAQTWGAPPMACFTLAVGCLKIGMPFAPNAAWIEAAQALWIAGVALSLFSAFYVPYLMFTRHELTTRNAYGSWLLPVVPPIVAPVPAALLATTWPLALRGSMLAVAYALLGLGIALAAILIVIFYARLLFHKIPEGALVTTMWLVIGPLGQSVAGIVALGIAAREVWPQFGHALFSAGVAYGLLVWGFGVYWLAMALATTIRAAVRGLPFALGWWALTFPVGTLTAASYALYAATGAVLFEIAGLALLALLAVNWTIVASGSLRHARAATGMQTPPRATPRLAIETGAAHYSI